MKNPKFPVESKIEFLNCACGKCFPCLVNRRKTWYFRLFHESLVHSYTYFLTLTMDDAHCDGELHPDDLAKFFKRLRKHVAFKYYAIGEYGTNTLRPHYHAILFCDEKLTPYLVQSVWSKGHIQLESSSPAAINYVLHYHVRPKEPIKGKRTFQRFSKQLGLTFIFDFTPSKKNNPSRVMLRNSSVLHSLQNRNYRLCGDGLGNTFVLPRYYVRKLQEQGLEIPEPSYNDKIPYIELFKQYYPDAEFDSRFMPINYTMDFVNCFLDDLFMLYNRKLDKYNYQTKNSL